jgi:hypothetical protein
VKTKDGSDVPQPPVAGGYGDPIAIHESGLTRIVLVLFYIPRSHGTELAVKIQNYRRSDPPNDWVLTEGKSVSLDETAARALLCGLREHLARPSRHSL